MNARYASRITITSVQPTALFARGTGPILHQAVDLEIEHVGSAALADVTLVVAGHGRRERCPVHTVPFPLTDAGAYEGRGPDAVIPVGTSTVRALVPDIREPGPVHMELRGDGGRVLAAVDTDWTPERHWTVYLCQQSHFDPGYTDMPSRVMAEYLEHLDKVIAWCDATEHHSDPDTRFRFTIEQAWVAAHYAENRSARQIGRLMHFLRNGQIEVSVLYANLISEILGAEEMVRAVYPAFDLKRRFDIPLTTAQHNDIPGISWGYITLLADLGIEVFAPEVPSYFSWSGLSFPNNISPDIWRVGEFQKAFWWAAQNGKRLLTFVDQSENSGTKDVRVLADLPATLTAAKRAGMPYTVYRRRVRGGGRDNCPPVFDLVHTARRHNEVWAYPRYVVATNRDFFRALRAEIDSGHNADGGPVGELPVWRGDYPGTDYPLGSVSLARENGAARIAADSLLAAERWAVVARVVADRPAARTAEGLLEDPGSRGAFREPTYEATISSAYESLLKADEHAIGHGEVTGWAAEASKKEHAVYGPRALALAEDVLAKAVNRVADQVRVEDDTPRILVFNGLDRPVDGLAWVPLSTESTTATSMMLRPSESGAARGPVWDSTSAYGRNYLSLPEGLCEAPFHVVDLESETAVSHQLLRVTSGDEPWPLAAEQRTGAGSIPARGAYVLIAVPDLPALGYRGFKVVAGRAPAGPEPAAPDASLRVRRESEDERADALLENAYYRVRVSGRTGAVLSLVDKLAHRDLIDGGAGIGFNLLFGRHAATRRMMPGGGVQRLRVESGPLRVSVLTTSSAPGAPQCFAEVALVANSRRVELNHRFLKDADGMIHHYLAFPFALAQPRFRYESALNVVRPVSDQLPGTNTNYYAVQHWAEAAEADGSYRVVLVPREAQMIQFGRNWPDYISQAHHGSRPAEFPEAFVSAPDGFGPGHMFACLTSNNFRTNFPVSQAGEIFARFVVSSIDAGFGGGEGFGRDIGWASRLPLWAVVLRHPHAGVLSAARGTFYSADPAHVMLLTLKTAEDGRGLVLRLLETEGRAAVARVGLPFTTVTAATLANAAEEPRAEASPVAIDPDGHALHIPLAPHDLVTLRLDIRGHGRSHNQRRQAR